MKKIAILIVLFCPIITFGQIPIPSMGTFSSEEIYQSAGSSAGGTWIRSKGSLSSDISGSKHLFDEKNLNATIFFNNKTKINIVNVNYNIENKSLESSLSKDSIFVISKDNIDYIKINNSKYTFFNDQLVGIIYSNKNNNIYKTYSVKVKEQINPLTKEYTGSNYAQYSNYNIVENGKLKSFKLNKKFIIGLLKDKEKEIKEYVEKNKLEYSNENHLIMIMNYYYSL